MELPISPRSYQTSPQALVRAAKRARVILARTIAQETTLDTATLFSNPDRSTVPDANWAADIHTDDESISQSTLDAITAHYHDRSLTCHTLDPVETECPAHITHQLTELGYQPITTHLYTLAHYQPPKRTNPSLQIIPARAAYAELNTFYNQMARTEHPDNDDQSHRDYAHAMIDRLDEPRLELFLGRIQNQTVASVGVTTLGQIGVIDPAYTHPAHRAQSIAATLIAHVLDHCARAQMQHVILERTDRCPSIPFYESLGFKPLAQYTKYVRST